PIAVALGVWTLWAPEAGRRRLVAFAASAGGFVVGWYTTPTVPLALEERGMALAALVLVIGVLSIFGCTATSPTDVRGGQVMVLRVRLARMFVAVVVASVFIGGGVGAGSELAPLVTTLVAVVVVAPFRSRTGPGPSPPPGG
ncbi:MAG: hypothetical protein KDB69_05010, partial [Acidimicrobiia bacterium]|nr:hypothetical protein [Acidimicrobiia bacterium]